MPRTPVAANIRATVTGNTLEPEMMAQLTQHKNEIARLISCTTSMQEHITQQSELVASLYSKLGDLKRDILLKGLNIDIPRGPETASPQKGLHVAIEGNIGAGKSYLVRDMQQLLMKNTACIVIPEPVNQWTSFGTQKTNVLNLMYSEPDKYSFLFQMVASITKVEELVEKEIEGVKLVERSFQAQQACFIPLLYENKAISLETKEVLDRTIELLLSYMPGVKPDLIIYLHTTPQAAMKRIITRGRPEESGIEIEYLARLHQKYEGWLRDPNFNTPVITVFASDVTAIKPHELAEKIIKFRSV